MPRTVRATVTHRDITLRHLWLAGLGAAALIMRGACALWRRATPRTQAR